jgi:sec-independent protein translocase protein TatA
LIALVVFGPKKLPELGKGLGEAIRGFKKALNEDDKQGITESESSNNEQKRSDR